MKTGTFNNSGRAFYDHLCERIEFALPSLPTCEAKVARVCIQDPIEFGNLTVKEISRMAHVSPPTVLRFCRSVGYSGFAELKGKCGGSLV